MNKFRLAAILLALSLVLQACAVSSAEKLIAECILSEVSEQISSCTS